MWSNLPENIDVFFLKLLTAVIGSLRLWLRVGISNILELISKERPWAQVKLCFILGIHSEIYSL